MSEFTEPTDLWPLVRAALDQQEYQRQLASLSVMGAPGRNPRYSGILSRPMSTQIGDILKVCGKPEWYPGDERDWATDVEQIVDREREEWRQRDHAIFEFYGISIDREPDRKDCWHRLALSLLAAHVPGFAIASVLHTKPPTRGAAPVLTREQTIRFANLVHEAATSGRDGSAAAIAKFVCAKHGGTLLVRHPTRQKRQDLKPLSRPTATTLVRQMREAWRDVRAGTASAFQYQVVNLALLPNTLTSDAWAVIFGSPRSQSCSAP